MRQQEVSKEELLKKAAEWNSPEVVGHHREEDGTVPGWHEWSRSHSQRDGEVIVCRGREEWYRQISQQQNNSRVLSLVSWNILSDTWFTEGKSEGQYSHTSPEEGEWSFRLQLLLHWIEQLNPDILALQEIDLQKFQDDLLPELTKRGYGGLMQKLKNTKKAKIQQPCGVATFWKSEKFQFIKEASRSRTQCVVLGSNNSSNNNNNNNEDQLVCITNVHLSSSQSEKGADERARQVNSALAYVAREAPNATLLLCGDCNTGADAQLFHVLREYSWHGHALSSVYEHPDTHNTLPVSHATFMVPGHHYVIDHILYDQDTLRLKCALDAFSHDEMEEHVYKKGEDCGFPSAFCPSDHIPIGVMFEMLPHTAARHNPEPLVVLSENT